MLLRMYLRYAERAGYGTTLLEQSAHTEAGVKSATIEIRGPYAYGFLRGEHGAHRLVRRSPFNSAGSRETSFAQVEVLPLVESDTEVALNPKDLKIDTYAAGGAGGQHVNRTESAVRVTHLPTGLTATCQSERSQHQNKAQALAVLRGRLAERLLAAEAAELRSAGGGRVTADFGGDAIRSYVLDDRRVKDRRTGYETRNPEAVLDGDLTPLIRAYLLLAKPNPKA
jgi:peptide chain release factor 2